MSGELLPLEEGQLIANRFRLVRPLSRGGMGAVWVAQHTNLGIEVAVKFVELSDTRVKIAEQEVFNRFRREANIIARLKSPHVVQILDYGIDEVNRPYLAMELLHGESLSERLHRVGQLTVNETARLVTQVAAALHRAHKAGVVHRDIKPPNLFLCEDEGTFLVKVLDFGIAKAEPWLNQNAPATESDHLTATGTLVGTPSYMSPEQALGYKDLDGRSDLFSLGIVAWRSLTGRLPYDPKVLPMGELLVAIATKQVPPPSTVLRSLSGPIDAWFAKALAIDRNERFADARTMADAFLNLVGEAPSSGSFPSIRRVDAFDTPPLVTGSALDEPSGSRSPSSSPPTAKVSSPNSITSASVAAPTIKPKRTTQSRMLMAVALVVVTVGVLVSLRTLRSGPGLTDPPAPAASPDPPATTEPTTTAAAPTPPTSATSGATAAASAEPAEATDDAGVTAAATPTAATHAPPRAAAPAAHWRPATAVTATTKVEPARPAPPPTGKGKHGPLEDRH